MMRDLGIALGLGLLVGMQREWADKAIAGIRTFALIALAGGLCGLIARETESLWTPAAGLLAIAWMFAVGNRMRQPSETAPGPGVTTEIAGIVMFLIGALVLMEHVVLGVVAAGAVALLLHSKDSLHQFVDRLGADDLRAVARLILIGMIILPVLPDEAYGPYDVLNPFRIWLMVVLIVGISMAAYVARRLIGAKAGTLLTGILGGLISSTATTVSSARRAHANTDESAAASVIVMIASTVVFGRVLFEVALVAPGLFGRVAPPLAIMMGLMLVICIVAFVSMRSRLNAPSDEQPPKDLAAAVIFGLLYAAVLLGISAVRDHFGEAALYVVAGLSGLTDMDAITLSSAQLMNAGSLETATGWRLILVGAMANLLFKFVAVALLGGRPMMRRLGVMFAASAVGGAALLWLWPY